MCQSCQREKRHFSVAGATICPFPFFLPGLTTHCLSCPIALHICLSSDSRIGQPRSHASGKKVLPHPLSAGNLVSLVVISSNPPASHPRSSCGYYHRYFESDFGICVVNGFAVGGVLMALAGRMRQGTEAEK